MILLLIAVFTAFALVTGIIIKMSPKERWKVVYFSIIDDINHNYPKDKIVLRLKKKYKMSDITAEAAIIATENHDEYWFKQNIK